MTGSLAVLAARSAPQPHTWRCSSTAPSCALSEPIIEKLNLSHCSQTCVQGFCTFQIDNVLSCAFNCSHLQRVTGLLQQPAFVCPPLLSHGSKADRNGGLCHVSSLGSHLRFLGLHPAQHFLQWSLLPKPCCPNPDQPERPDRSAQLVLPIQSGSSRWSGRATHRYARCLTQVCSMPNTLSMHEPPAVA